MHEPPLPRFIIQTFRDANLVEVALPANIEAIEFDTINQELGACVVAKMSGKWIIDLSGAEYFGSALLGMLINMRAKVRSARGKMVLCQVGPALDRVIKVSSMERLFTIVETREEAHASL